MATQIIINSIVSGQIPYNIYVCDTCNGGTCQYIATTSTIPYSFTLPPSYENFSSFFIKIVDSKNCVYCEKS